GASRNSLTTTRPVSFLHGSPASSASTTSSRKKKVETDLLWREWRVVPERVANQVVQGRRRSRHRRTRHRQLRTSASARGRGVGLEARRLQNLQYAGAQ